MSIGLQTVPGYLVQYLIWYTMHRRWNLTVMMMTLQHWLTIDRCYFCNRFTVMGNHSNLVMQPIDWRPARPYPTRSEGVEICLTTASFVLLPVFTWNLEKVWGASVQIGHGEDRSKYWHIGILADGQDEGLGWSPFKAYECKSIRTRTPAFLCCKGNQLSLVDCHYGSVSIKCLTER